MSVSNLNSINAIDVISMYKDRKVSTNNGCNHNLKDKSNTLRELKRCMTVPEKRYMLCKNCGRTFCFVDGKICEENKNKGK